MTNPTDTNQASEEELEGGERVVGATTYSLHNEAKIREGELRAILGIKNFLEGHSIWVSWNIRSVKKRNLLYMHMLDKMVKDRQLRDAVIVGDVDNYLYNEEKGWVELRKEQMEAEL